MAKIRLDQLKCQVLLVARKQVVPHYPARESGMRKYLYLMLGVGLFAAGSASAIDDCKPKKQTCGEEPLTYECPPCPPTHLNKSAAAAENYRSNLEDFRATIEKTRQQDHAFKPAYDKAIVQYKDGIETYSAAIASPK
jgi:hypothetical protein